MDLAKFAMTTACFLISAVTYGAPVWSTCQAVTAVTNEPTSGSILVTLSPGIASCSPQGVAGAIEFVVGQDGVAATNMDSLLAASLSALAIGRQVQVGYDTSSANCYSISIAIGGYLGDC